MALTKNTTTVHALEIANAYFRVESVCLISKTAIQYSVQAYKDSTQWHAFWNTQMSSTYDITGENPIKQAYEYLKTLPEFADATDC